FAPLGMKDATYRLYGSDGFPGNIAAAHNAQGNPLPGRFPICPEQAASGLYSTTRDLALLLIDMQKALAGKESKLISKKAAEMLTTVVLDDYALGFRIRRFGWIGECFAHGGSNQGIGGFFFASMSGGRGLVFLASGSNRGEINGDIARGLAEIYGWNAEQKEAAGVK
ncbi:MAG: beta-lactamase family protein, partial [Holophagales bacterium]|nr:beta-lactamase family protein [Holophagales bacterium]